VIVLTPNPAWLDGVVYDEVGRQHLIDGVPRPSVTQVLKAAKLTASFDRVPGDVLGRKASIGSAAHAAAHYHDEGDLAVATVAEAAQPRLAAWRWFREQRGVEDRDIVLLETVVCSRLYQYVGRIDRLLWCDGWLTLLDLKTGTLTAADLQTMAYLIALREQHPELRDVEVLRWAIELRPNGKYALHAYPERGRTSRQDRADFLQAVAAERLLTEMNGGVPTWR
jgi:hypothetical protein